MYLSMPQGYLASGDAYTRSNKTHPLQSKNSRKHPILRLQHRRSLLSQFRFRPPLRKRRGHTQSRKVSILPRHSAGWGSPDNTLWCNSSKSILEAILSCPIPKILTDARSWFGWANQVAWVYSPGPIIFPLRGIVKRDSQFIWNKSLEDTFEHSEKKS